jgi:hypothetical protein
MKMMMMRRWVRRRMRSSSSSHGERNCRVAVEDQLLE